MKKAIAIIPARGGSKRIPKKNIKLFFDKPLIAYSIEIALKSGLFDKVIVSTDDKEIADIAKKYGAEVPFIRSGKLSDDYVTTGEVISDAILQLKNLDYSFDFVCTIYPTAPLLQVKYLVDGLNKLKNSDAYMTFSATSMAFPIQRTFKLTEKGRCQMFFPKYAKTRSQDLEEAYQDAGQFYWKNISKKLTDTAFGKDSIPIILPRYLVQDIDTIEDWNIAELMYEIVQKRENND